MGKKERERAALRGKGRIDPNDNDDNGDNNNNNNVDLENERDDERAHEAEAARRVEEINALLDDALESRASTRQTAFTKLISLLSSSFDADRLELAVPSFKVALQRALKKAVESKSVDELLAPLRVLQLLVVTLGADVDLSLFAEFDALLKSLLKDTAEPRCVSALWQTLSLLTFVAGSEDVQALAVMDELTPHLKRDRVAGQVLRCWGFLASIVSPDIVVQRLFESHLPIFVAMLESTDADVHVAAANNIALLFDHWKAAMALDNRDIGIEECSVVDVDDVRDRVAALAHSVAKQSGASEPQKRHWRVMLRRVARALTVADEGAHEDDQPDDDLYDQLEFKGQRVLVQGFSMLIQVDFFRSVLGTGFSAHMASNPLLHDVFGGSIESIEKKAQSSFLKRRENQKVTKERERGRGKGREMKEQKNKLAESHEFDDED